MKSKFQLFLLIAISSLFYGSCTTVPEKAKAIDMSQLKTEIQAMEDAFAAAEKAKDANAVVAYYSDDAISYNRNEEPSVGKAAIKEHIERNLARDSSGQYNVYKVVDLFADGDMATEIGSWTSMDKSGVVINKGHYMSCFQKRDGKYVCVRDMNVTSMPAKL